MANRTFADTHSMVVFLSKSDASAGFNQIVDFLNAQVIQYALMVNPTIYVSCIKQFWATTLIKKVNDVVKLQALIDRKKVVVTEDFIRQDLRLDDADGRKFNFSKYIFDNMVRNVDSPSKFLMYLRFLQVLINNQVDDLSSHTTKYTSHVLTQKVFSNMRRIGKGFSDIETPLFATMLVQPQAAIEEDDEEDEVPARRKEDDNVVIKEVNAAETTVFDDKEVTMTVAQTLIKMKAKKARILDEQMAKRLKYQILKRKPISVSQAKKNMIVYLKNMARYKMAHFKGSHSTQHTPTDDPKEISKEDVKNMLEIVLVSEFKVEALQKLHSNCDVHQVSSTTRRHDMFMLAEKDYPLSNGVMTLMLSTKLQVEEDSEMARDLVMKIFMKANQPKSKSLDTSSK
nr:xylulose kinase-1 [Tanacetum cinerariifolium]